MTLDRQLTADERTAEILREVENLLRDPTHWTRGALGRDDQGHSVMDPDSYETDYEVLKDAACWCLEGACYAVGMRGSEWGGVLRALQAATGTTPFKFNDDPKTTHVDVLSAVHQARRIVGGLS